MPSAASIGDCAAGGDHRALPGVEGRERVEQTRAEGNVLLVFDRRRDGPRADPPAQRSRRDLMGADHPHAFALEDRGKPDEQAIVAPTEQRGEFGRLLDRAPIEPQVGEFGADESADQHDFADAASLQRGEQLAHLAHPDPGMRVSLDAMRRGPDNSDQKGRASRSRGVCRDFERESAGAAKDRERGPRRVTRPDLAPVDHASSLPARRGTVTWRSPPARRKATICCTADRPGNALATSSDPFLQRALRPRTAFCRRGAIRGVRRAKSRAA